MSADFLGFLDEAITPAPKGATPERPIRAEDVGHAAAVAVAILCGGLAVALLMGVL